MSSMQHAENRIHALLNQMNSNIRLTLALYESGAKGQSMA